MFHGVKPFALYGRGEAGVCCDVDGVGLGPLKLVERAEKSYFVRPVEDIIQMLEVAYGPLPGAVAEDLVLKIISIARSLNGGNMTQAMFKTLYLRLPEIPAENMAKMNRGVSVEAEPRIGTEMTVAGKVAAEVAAWHLEEALNKALEMSLAGKGAKVNNVVAKAGFNPAECRDDFGRWCGDSAAASVYHGKKYSVSTKVAGNIIYNETRSFSGPQRDEAMAHIAHVIYNRADGGMPIGGKWTSSSNVDEGKVPKAEQETYNAAQAAAVKVLTDRTDNKEDPTMGAVYYNLRGSDSKEPWRGYENSTHIGPFDNSYPTDGIDGHVKNENNLPASGVYVNTYYNRQVVKPKK